MFGEMRKKSGLAWGARPSWVPLDASRVQHPISPLAPPAWYPMLCASGIFREDAESGTRDGSAPL